MLNTLDFLSCAVTTELGCTSDNVSGMSNDLLVKESEEQIDCEHSSSDYASAAATAVMPVASLSSSTDTSQDSDTKDSSSNDMSRKKPMSITIDIDDAAAKERRQIEELDFRFLCIDMRTLPGYLQFLTCCAGVFFFYLIYGYCQVTCVYYENSSYHLTIVFTVRHCV